MIIGIYLLMGKECITRMLGKPLAADESSDARLQKKRNKNGGIAILSDNNFIVLDTETTGIVDLTLNKIGCLY